MNYVNFFKSTISRISTVLYCYFFLGGPILIGLMSMFFIKYTFNDFLIWLFCHFIMVTGLSVVYHRYFAHKSYQANRFVQFILALWGTLCLERGPLWWSSNHRLHHHYCGTINDPHSPIHGFYQSHFGWTLDPRYIDVQWEFVPDFAKFPEIRLLEYAYLFWIPFFSVMFYWLGGAGALIAYHIAITTSVNTISCVNSVCHSPVEGKKNNLLDKKSMCRARNIKWVVLFGAGEGFHGNHHDIASSAFFGKKWYHFDLSYLLIRLMGSLKIIKNIKVN